jgi:hypothetical protein
MVPVDPTVRRTATYLRSTKHFRFNAKNLRYAWEALYQMPTLFIFVDLFPEKSFQYTHLTNFSIS